MQGLQPGLVLSLATVCVDRHPPDPAASSQTTGSRFRRGLASLEGGTQTTCAVGKPQGRAIIRGDSITWGRPHPDFPFRREEMGVFEVCPGGNLLRGPLGLLPGTSPFLLLVREAGGSSSEPQPPQST